MTPALRDRLLALAERRQALLDELVRRPRGLSWCQEHTAIVDDAVSTVVAEVSGEYNLPFCVVATGGYGRRELSPYSDVDIAVVPADEDPSLLDPAVKAFFLLVGEAAKLLGLELGYMFLLISDAPGLDAKSRTGLIDSRLIAGPAETFGRLLDALAETMPTGQFILHKIRERQDAFAKYHDTPLVSEPQLKEGAGGLRCFQTASWLGIAVGREALRPSRDYSFICRVRNCLHQLAGRRQDILTRTRRDEIAERLGLDPYEFGSVVCSSGLTLTSAFEEATRNLHESRFFLSRGVIAVRGEARVLAGADAGEAAAGIAIATDLGLQVEDVRVTPGSQISGSAASYAVAHGEATLRNLDRAGLLDLLMPELSACRTLISRDNAHTFTVMEHTLRAVRALDSLEPGSFLGNLKESLTDRQTLYLAILLHDLGKTDPDRPHSESGEVIAHEVGSRWRLRAEMVDTVAWLVREHLTMAKFLRLRDIENPETIREFRDIIGTAERLDLLTLLTWADVKAVSSSAWTTAQDAFLKNLYEATSALLHSGETAVESAPAYRQRLARQFQNEDADDADVHAFIDSLPAHYLTSTSPAIVRLHYRLAEKAREGDATVEVHTQTELGATEFTVCCPDQPGLLSKLLGVLYAFDLSMLGVRASTTTSEPPIALDVLTASLGGRVVPAATAQQISKALYAVIHGSQSVREILVAHQKDPDLAQRVFSFIFVPGTPSVLELRAPRGRGMPYRFSRKFTDLGWNILAARVGQWADSAAAAFYVEGPGGRPLLREEVEAALREPAAT